MSSPIKIDHFRICPAFRCGEGQAADRADKLLELICIAGIDGPVTGIMGTRCQLIDQDFAGPGQKHLDGQHTLDIERIGNFGSR